MVINVSAESALPDQPWTALLTIGAADILTKLFTEVVIPEAVRNELLRSHPHLPPWLRVEAVRNLAQARENAQIVDVGEAEAIELARGPVKKEAH